MIDNITRYRAINDSDFYGAMVSDNKGKYVKFSDYENRVADLIDDLSESYNKPDQSKIIASLEAENELLRNEIKQIRAITEIKDCLCKRKFVKQIPSLILDPTLILKENQHE